MEEEEKTSSDTWNSGWSNGFFVGFGLHMLFDASPDLFTTAPASPYYTHEIAFARVVVGIFMVLGCWSRSKSE